MALRPKSSTKKSGTVKTSSKEGGKRKTTLAASPKKAEIEAMLLVTQRKLFHAETTLEAQDAELVQLRERTSELQTELTNNREKYYDSHVELAMACRQRDEAKATTVTTIAEIRHLTKILAIATDKTDKAESAQKFSQNDLSTLEKEISELRTQLDTAKKDAEDLVVLRKRLHEQDQRLEGYTQEVVQLTKLLDENNTDPEEDLDMLRISAQIGKTAVNALIAPPDAAPLDQARLDRAAAILVESGLFDPEWYLEENGDVAEANRNPALHFLEYGFTEGRLPRLPE